MLQHATYVLTETGEPQRCENLDHWLAWMATHSRRVAIDYLADDLAVSTVFIGLSVEDPPRLFETLIMGGPYNGTAIRGVDYAEALDNHRTARRLALGDGGMA